MAPSPRADVWLLFTTRTIRLFAYGCLPLVLVMYLKAVGLDANRIGLLLTMTLLGDTVLSLWITTSADRVGRKGMLIAGAGLMVLGGLGFAATDNFWLLLLAAILGVISPSGNEVGPFLAIEQAGLAEVVAPERRTGTFAWYNLAGSLATAAGTFVCGWLLNSMKGHEITTIQSCRILLLGYAGVGVLLAVLFTRLSPATEAVAPAQGQESPPRGLLGLHRSRGIVLRLSALFSLDAFAGGFVVQTLMILWFRVRFDADPLVLGYIFSAANLLAGVSALAAAAIARRIGLINTMVFTHVPSNLLLILVPFMRTLPLAVVVLLLRFAISQMDVPTRQAYTAAVVSPDERSAAAGVTGVARTTGAALSPALGGALIDKGVLIAGANSILPGAPFIISGVLKLIYDGLLYKMFRGTAHEEQATPRT
jgi:MFS family permease